MENEKVRRNIFVFGSNTRGMHGAGAARFALQKYGAIYWQGEGLQGNSYALPTLDGNLDQLNRIAIEVHVERFLCFAAEHPEMDFQVTRVGCGLAGFLDSEIAPLFASAPANCKFDSAWTPWLGDRVEYWGTF
jgi:hypothetical protein